jgi:hypothetical protein
MNPADAIGYCAVIVPSLDHWQAYYIIDTETVRQNAVNLQMGALVAASKANPIGSLQAALAEGAISNNQSVVASAALALRGVVKLDYFVVIANPEPEGMRTSMQKLDASSIDEARKMIDNLPEVAEIKKRLTTKLSMRDGRGRQRAFH